ncbi:MAG TPA: hypothetical protein ENN68_02265 [Methanomicrobia archaeon]|nr:hypothetical protein [Methanomicrobia archaeon]
MQADSIYAGSVATFIEQSLRKQSLQLAGDGAQPGSLCFVSDMVEGILQFLAMDDGGGTVLNLGSDEAIQLAEVAKMITGLTSSSSRIFRVSEPASEPHLMGSFRTSPVRRNCWAGHRKPSSKTGCGRL